MSGTATRQVVDIVRHAPGFHHLGQPCQRLGEPVSPACRMVGCLDDHKNHQPKAELRGVCNGHAAQDHVRGFELPDAFPLRGLGQSDLVGNLRDRLGRITHQNSNDLPADQVQARGLGQQIIPYPSNTMVSWRVGSKSRVRHAVLEGAYQLHLMLVRKQNISWPHRLRTKSFNIPPFFGIAEQSE